MKFEEKPETWWVGRRRQCYIRCFIWVKGQWPFLVHSFMRGKWVRYDLSGYPEVPMEFSKEYAVACCVKYSSDLSGRTGIIIPALGTINTFL